MRAPIPGLRGRGSSGRSAHDPRLRDGLLVAALAATLLAPGTAAGVVRRDGPPPAEAYGERWSADRQRDALKDLELSTMRAAAAREMRERRALRRAFAHRSERPRDLDEPGGARGPVSGLRRPTPLGAIPGAPPNHPMNDRSGEHSLFSTQAEVSLAAWHGFLVAAWNDGEEFVSGGDAVSYGWSADGGVTWHDRGALPRGTGVGLWTSDPCVTVDERTGRFTIAGMIITSGARNGLAVVGAVPSDTGLVVSPPVVVRGVRDTLPDKVWVNADSLTGRLYIAYTTFYLRGQKLTDQIEFQRSLDGGTQWSPPQKLTAPAEDGLVQGVRLACGPDGELHAVWKTVDTTRAGGGLDWIRIRTSRDGGESFAPPHDVTGLYTNFGSGAPGFNRPYGFSFPGLAVDRSAGPYRGRVYVAWNESVNYFGDRLGTGDAVVESEPNNGTAQATIAFPGQVLRGVIADGTDTDYYRLNGNRGQTLILYLDSLATGMDVSMRLFCGDGNTRLAWCAPPESRPRLLVYTLPGTGDYLLRVTIGSGAGGGYRILTGLHGTAAERAHDHRDAFVAHSDDGIRWSVPRELSDAPPWFDEWLPEVAVTPRGRVAAAWYDWRDASSVLCGGASVTYLATSGDGGEHWGAGRPLADEMSRWSLVGANLAPNQGDYIGLFAAGETAHVAWADGRFGDPDVMMASADLSADPAPAARGVPIALEGPWPNPTAGPMSLRVSLPAATPATVTLLDPAGRRLRSLRLVPRAAGWQWADLGSGDGLPPGLYFIRVEQAGLSASRKVVLLR